MGRCPSARLYLAEPGGYFYGSLNVGTGTDDKGVQLVSSGEFGALIGFGAQQSTVSTPPPSFSCWLDDTVVCSSRVWGMELVLRVLGRLAVSSAKLLSQYCTMDF